MAKNKSPNQGCYTFYIKQEKTIRSLYTLAVIKHLRKPRII